jgi:3-isopropylmalate/(R)-2-methylmalate dehydratase small subunit
MRAWKFGDNIDTDAIIPGRFLTIYDEKELARHAFEGIRDDFAKLAKDGLPAGTSAVGHPASMPLSH